MLSSLPAKLLLRWEAFGGWAPVVVMDCAMLSSELSVWEKTATLVIGELLPELSQSLLASLLAAIVVGEDTSCVVCTTDNVRIAFPVNRTILYYMQSNKTFCSGLTLW